MSELGIAPKIMPTMQVARTYSVPLHSPLAEVEEAQYRRPRFFDPLLLVIALSLLSFGLIMIYSTTGVVAGEKLGDSWYYVRRQSIAAALGLLMLVIGSRLPRNLLEKLSPLVFPTIVVLLALPLISGIGDRAGGATRWINLGPIRFQPAELVKVLFVVFFAGYLARHESRIHSFKYGILTPFMFLGVVGGLLLVQPDFGSTAVIALTASMMALATGVRLRFVLLGAVLLTLTATALILISPYRMERVMTFLKPWDNTSGSGYQLVQSLVAIGLGQLDGVGLGASQQKLFFLPAAHTDFIFAVVAEELGFIGAVSLLLLFAAFLWRGFRIAARFADDAFGFSLAVGLTMLIVMPAMLNVGVVTGMLPTKGMVLPLVGYGGSSLITSLFAVGILLSLARGPTTR